MITYDENDWVVEPANVISISCVTSVNLANYAKSSCEEPMPVEERPVYTYARWQGFTGDLLLEEGYNTELSQRDNVIKVEAVNRMNDYIGNIDLDYYIRAAKRNGVSVDSKDLKNRKGFQKSRDEIPITTAEAILINEGINPDGCESYNNLINSINGVAGPNINLKGGPGIDISVDPEDEHTLIIKLDTQHLKDGCEVTYPEKTESTDF